MEKIYIGGTAIMMQRVGLHTILFTGTRRTRSTVVRQNWIALTFVRSKIERSMATALKPLNIIS